MTATTNKIFKINEKIPTLLDKLVIIYAIQAIRTPEKDKPKTSKSAFLKTVFILSASFTFTLDVPKNLKLSMKNAIDKIKTTKIEIMIQAVENVLLLKKPLAPPG